MVGMMLASSREKAADLLNSAKLASETPSKLKSFHLFRDLVFLHHPSLLPDFFPRLLDLHSNSCSPLRKLLAGLIGEIGLEHVEFIPDIVPVLIAFLKDDTPAVTRQAIISGTYLFRNMLERVAVQGLFSNELNDLLDSFCTWMLKFKDAVCSLAFQSGSDGVRLMALKFVEAMILLYTPDPNGSSQPLPHQTSEGKIAGFDISWLRSGHAMLKVGDLAMEASQSLDLLLDQLRIPLVKSLSHSIVIVLVNSLSAIANKRPAFYGRILPVLIGLDPSSSIMKGVQVAGVHNALKNAFQTFLNCTHPAAAPWHDRLVDALETLKSGKLPAQAVTRVENINDNTAQGMGESCFSQDEKLSTHDGAQNDQGRKRSIDQDGSDVVRDDDTRGKRIKVEHVSECQTNNMLPVAPSLNGGQLPLPGLAGEGDGDTGAVQQLGAMLGALVTQADKAADFLEIIFSSMSSDLLAEVVMANMRYLPPTRPKDEGEEEPIPGIGIGSATSLDSSNKPAVQSSSVPDVQSLPGAFLWIASLLNIKTSAALDDSNLHVKDEQQPPALSNTAQACASTKDVISATMSAASPVPEISPVSPEKVNEVQSFPSDMNDEEMLKGEIPGLHSTVHDEMHHDLNATLLTSDDSERMKQGQAASPSNTLSNTFSLDSQVSGSLSTCKSEVHSPNVAVSDLRQATPATSVTVPSLYILPKMSVTIISLTNEQKDDIQKSAFVRIVEAYKQLALVGESDLRSSLLTYLGVEYPLELDSWGVLQKHILSDFTNHEGHELTLRVLYRLFREAEQDNDFFSSTNATSIYESFLLTVAETLRDSFPASDKCFSRLLCEVPYLPKKAFKLLECLCSPGSDKKIDKEAQGGDRVTQGLSAVWSLIVLRPTIRDVCLKIALQSAVHHLQEVRMKAIRLVANKLYPMSSIAQQIEDFANEMLLSVANNSFKLEDTSEESHCSQKDTNHEGLSSAGQQGVTSADVSCASQQLSSSQALSSAAVSEALRCMSLYFALCTKKHSLLRQIFVIYKTIPTSVKQAIHLQIPILVRTIGSSPELISIISDPPNGSESLLMQVLQTLTDGTVPSPELIFTVRRLYDSKLKDVEVLIPVLSFLSKDEVLPIFPHLVNLPSEKFQPALGRLLQGSSHSGPALTPAEVLIAIHGIDPERDGIPLKKIIDACSACFEQRQVFTQQVLAKVLNQLVEQIPLPLLFMRTVIQTIGYFPALVDFIMEILSRLVSKQIWKYPKLWVGFLKCVLQTKPQSFHVLLQLPAAQLEIALHKNPGLKAPLAAHANQPNVRASLPRSTLLVLGLAQDSSQTGGQTQTTQTAESGNSGADAAAEVVQESAVVT